MELLPVADGVHAWLQADGSWWLNNAGVIVGADDVVLIDTWSRGGIRTPTVAVRQ